MALANITNNILTDTGVLVSSLQPLLTNPVTGTGTTNYLPKFTGTSTIGNSVIQEASGSIGINVSPVADLQVGKSSGVTIAMSNSSSVTSGTRGGISWYNSSVSTVADIRAVAVTDNVGTQLEFYTRPVGGSLTQAMTLNASGNLGLGVSPSAWTVNAKVIDINTKGAFWSGSGVDAAITGNAYYDSVGAKYKTTAAATDYWQIAGEHRWYNAPSGTAGNAISFTQAMTLNASGNLSIGNTNDTYKLDVTGTGRFTGNGFFGGATVFAGLNGGISVNGSSNSGINFRTSDTLRGYVYTASGNMYLESVSGSVIISPNGNPALTIASTGAATFSSSVTARTSINLIHSNSTAVFKVEEFSGTQGAGLSLFNSSGTQNVLFNAGGDSFIRGGNVGIGTASPTGLLHIFGTDPAFRIQNSGTGNMQMGQWDGTNNRIQSSGRDFLLTQTDSFNMLFHTNSTERMRITSGGDIRITSGGTTNAATLELTSDATPSNGSIIGVSYLGSGSYGPLRFATGGSERMRITSDGNLLINTTTNSGNKLEVNGTARFGSVIVGSLGTGTVYSNGGTLTNTNPSDRRLKTNVIPLTYGLADILKLNPVSYNWKDGTNGKQFGFIAQEVQEIMPDAVKPGEYLGLEKDAIYSALVNSVKELNKEIELLKSQIK
jgi:hypothetical protein